MRLLVTMIAVFFCVLAMAQKPKINKAKAAYDKGDLAKAKTIIDQATEYKKTKDKAKTWYYRGMIYATLDTANNEPEAMQTAIASFKKAVELDPEQKSINEIDLVAGGVVNVDTRLQGYYAHYYKVAIENYQAEEFTLAADNFEKAFFIMPSDTNSVINAAHAADEAGEGERAKANYEKSLDAGATNKSIYLRLYNYAVKGEDYDEAVAVIRRSREVYPDDVNLQKYEINLLIQQDRVDEAKAEIEEAIAKEPNNPDLHSALGLIKEGSGDLEGARAGYEKAMEVDANHFNSIFNLGVMVFNEASELIKERNALSYKEEREFNELSVQITEQLEAALPYWEKLYSLKKDDTTVLEMLGYIYTSLKMNDKAEKISEEFDAIKG